MRRRRLLEAGTGASVALPCSGCLDAGDLHPALEGDEVWRELVVDTGPQLSRHEGYETAFFGDGATLELEERG